jgi:hypothetical protein
MGRRSLGEAEEDGGVPTEYNLLQKFYRKYPEIKYMPVLGPIQIKKGGQMNFSHPASIFIRKQ